MDEFEELLLSHKGAVERFVRFKISSSFDADDVLQEIFISASNSFNITEQYLNKEGKTILWRRFNRNDWAFGRYKKLWSEQFPENEQLNVNGTTYVHWYDCIVETY